jgi:hypothetical protein
MNWTLVALDVSYRLPGQNLKQTILDFFSFATIFALYVLKTHYAETSEPALQELDPLRHCIFLYEVCSLIYRVFLLCPMFSKVKERGNSTWNMGAYAPTTGKKHFQNTKKFKQKFKYVRLDILCARAKFCGKPTFL